MSALRSTSRPALAVLAAGVAAGLLLIATEFAPIAKVDVAEGSCEVINDADPGLADRCSLSGFERHGGAFVALGALTLVMTYGAGLGGSRPAALALLVIAAIVLAITFFSDLPQTSETGAIGPRFEGAKASAGSGFWLELGGGLLAAGAGAGAMLGRVPQRPASPR
jgi:hypothetical protein